MLTERCKIETTKAQSLQKICDYRYAVSTYVSVVNGIKQFNADLQNQIAYANEFSTAVHDDIISPLTALNTKITHTISTALSNLKSARSNYLHSVRSLEDAKTSYHDSARAVEEFKSQTSSSSTTEHATTLQALITKSKHNEQLYMNAIDTANDAQDVYIEYKKAYLTTLQDFEEEIGQNIQNALMKLLVFQVAHARNLQYDTNTQSNVYEQMNITNDIMHFIYNNQSTAIPPYKFEFVPYVHDCTLPPKPNTQDTASSFISPVVVSNVKSFFSNVFFSGEAPSPSNVKITQTAINELVTALYEGKVISSEFRSKIISYIKDKRTRRLMLEAMNTYRLKEKAVLTDSTYFSIGVVLKDYLNYILKENDYISAKMLMSLATALHKNNPQPHQPRIFMQTYLHDHTLWNSFEFWKGIVRFSIVDEMHSQKGYNIYSNESFEEKQQRIKKIAENVLSAQMYNMIAFTVSESLIREVVNECSEYYEVESEFRKEMESIIKEYVANKQRTQHV